MRLFTFCLFFAITCPSFANDPKTILILEQKDKIIEEAEIKDRITKINPNFNIVKVVFSDSNELKAILEKESSNIFRIQGLIIASHGSEETMSGFGQLTNGDKLADRFSNALHPLKGKLERTASVVLVSCNVFCGPVTKTTTLAQQLVNYLENYDGEVVGSTRLLFMSDRSGNLPHDQFFPTNQMEKEGIEKYNIKRKKIRRALGSMLVATTAFTIYIISKLILTNQITIDEFHAAFWSLSGSGILALIRSYFQQIMYNSNELVSFKFLNGEIIEKKTVVPNVDRNLVVDFAAAGRCEHLFR